VKERIITGICLLAAVLPLVYFGGYWFMGLMLIVTVIATWEMMAMHDTLIEVPLLIKIIAIVVTLGVAFSPTISMAWYILGIHLIFLWFIYFAFKAINMETRTFYIRAPIYIGLSFRALLGIRNHSLTLFIFLIAIVILTDSMAYFTGRFFGKHKLAPKISPKKTIEGAIGGWLSGAAFAIGFGLLTELFAQMWILFILAFFLPILSQIGDLVASALKRKYDIKDFGKLFPGHGGVMDRVDSQMLAAILIYVIILFGRV